MNQNHFSFVQQLTGGTDWGLVELQATGRVIVICSSSCCDLQLMILSLSCWSHTSTVSIRSSYTTHPFLRLQHTPPLQQTYTAHAHPYQQFTQFYTSSRLTNHTHKQHPHSTCTSTFNCAATSRRHCATRAHLTNYSTYIMRIQLTCFQYPFSMLTMNTHNSCKASPVNMH